MFKKKSSQPVDVGSFAPATKTKQRNLHTLVPCRPAPLFTFSHNRDVWVLSDEEPAQNFWKIARPASIGLDIKDDAIGLWRYGQEQSEFAPSRSKKENVVAIVGKLKHNGQSIDVGMCMNRLGVMKGLKENAVRAVRQIQREYANSDVGVAARCHYSDKLTSQDLQSIARMSVGKEPSQGSLVVCDLEYDTGRWNDQLVETMASTPWVGSLFYLENGSDIEGSVVWDTSKTDEICEGVGIVPSADLEHFVKHEDVSADREPFWLSLRGAKGVMGVGMVSPALPARGTEALRLISVLRYANMPTDTETLADYMEGRSDEAVQLVDGILGSLVDLLGNNLDSKARLFEDKNGWAHTLPLRWSDPNMHGEEKDPLETYRWFPLLGGYVSQMLKEH